ncbi:uncharacterized protein LOC113333777 isoform X1 [Papaver somniferum]|uniref:uncharacterized protein LOC113333777 isoform X1 n=1 Tax=Papaver somniferum TaxID=3469 RepID=UPI000E6F91F6|nr:uncharacterized protein LOC113333777 isoform X1 [Papaver somniferum]XP_026435966.1 uncharacterized protein LOC113333777 isoform X1 [Papaver somniferum]XP_026435967.1 uncharacterized protein LOC113333777 isoform X1 [Papaver somniferum]XP_026435970.1 uncharacterized protein LOC113333777 isoform X1 [Papaver somniferum]
MNSTQKIRGADLETPFPGCMGRMVNLFDFGPGMTGNKLLIDKEHQNAPRGRPEVIKKTLDPIGDQIEEKQIGCELKRSPSNTKYNGTPMKTLIAQEMSRENGCKQNPPSVVAKLMGLDTLPERQPNSAAQRSQSNGYRRNAFSQPGTPNRYMQQDNDFLDRRRPSEIPPYQDHLEYKDVYEVWQNSPKSCYGEDKLPQGGRHKESQDEKKMALVREKFIEAKRLSMNEKHRQSNEFQEALEFLSSNKDLFLKLLQEPNSVFSNHLNELQSIPPPAQTKRITVLKPSRTMENNGYVGFERKSEKPAKKQNQVDEANGWSKKNPGWSSPFTNNNTDHSAPPTRIVVLKPSPGKAHDIKAVVSSLPLSPRLYQSNDFYEELENDEMQSSRKVAMEITLQMRGSVDSQQKEETVNSSVFSNGYVGDESSFNRSENEFIEEGNLSETEVVTPTSRYSWDYGNRFGSPYSSSSFSRASLSPESSVCREAKKRLSERWAVVASNRIGQEQRQVRRSSSTLGEMLALSDVNKSVRSGEVGSDGRQCVPTSKSCGGEQDLSYPLSSLAIFTGNIHGGEDSPKNLVRSRSLPVSSTVYGTTLVDEVSNPPVSKASISNEVSQSKNGKSSFKGKVSSLFFLRNKKTIKEKLNVSFGSGSDKEPQSAIAELPVVAKKSIPDIASDIIPPSVTNIGAEGFSVHSPRGSFCNNTSPASVIEPNQGIFSNEAVPCAFKPWFSGSRSENQDQPSPISVLERPFEDDVSSTMSYDNIKSDIQAGEYALLRSFKSNLISKSPPIGSLARSLSWDDSCSDVATTDPLNSCPPLSEAEEEQERFLFVQSLLSSTSLDWNGHSDNVFTRWHSPECPLDPSVLDKFFNQVEVKEQTYGAKCRNRKLRSNHKLLFDCVNTALMDIIGYGTETSLWTRMSSNSSKSLSIGESVIMEEVWSRVKEWFSNESKCFSRENGDNNGLVVETVVRKEVVGRGWVELMRLEVDGIGNDIEGEVLEELVDEALFDLTGRLC